LLGKAFLLTSKVTYVTLSTDERADVEYEAALEHLRHDLDGYYPMYIDGAEVQSEDGEFEHRSPIDTSIVVGHFQKGTSKHARLAIEAAKRSLEVWNAMQWQERVRIMRRAADLMDQRKFEIAAAITYEVGKTRLEASAEASEAVDAIRFYANIMEENNGYAKRLGPGAPGEDCRMVSKPYGVWVVISPFNFPFMLANGMALGALITGNTVVLKPTSEAPLTGLMLYMIYRDAGVPKGVVNFVTGPGPEFEEEFTSNPDVAGIAFTGSRDVGLRLRRKFLPNQSYPKPMVLEMGSKNPTVVTASADLKKAVEGIIRASFGYDGQKCSATSRVYVQDKVRSQLLTMLTTRVKELVAGDPRRKDTFLGPLINQAAIERYTKAIEDAKRSGATIVYGGHVLNNGDRHRGYYVEPTIITDLPSDHRLFREELFVPMILVDEFKSLDEALRKANDTDYGLTAGIFAEDPREIQEFMNKIEFGVAYANRRGGATTGAWPGAQTFVGWKGSGATGKGIGGPNYLLTFIREQSQTVVTES
jgi:1-pyrroline-5-carboxylate dehydrogenase